MSETTATRTGSSGEGRVQFPGPSVSGSDWIPLTVVYFDQASCSAVRSSCVNCCDMFTRADDDAGDVALLDLVVDPGERERELVVREGDVREVRVHAREVLRVEMNVELALGVSSSIGDPRY